MKTAAAVYAFLLILVSAGSLSAQSKPAERDPLVGTIGDGAAYARDMIQEAAEQMPEAEYSFKPTEEVRSFGGLLAHIADTNYYFCSLVLREGPPASGLEKSLRGRDEIRKALAESYTYCEGALKAIEDPEKASAIVEFQGSPRPAFAVMIFRTHHSLLHYGNIVTYMRLRGRVPPSSQ